MNEENLKIWNAVKQPPASALRQIQVGRLSGKTDINPQWRYQAMTEQFGICGIGWRYEVVRLWSEPGPDNQVFAFAQINLYIKIGEQWSDAIPGIGGHMLTEKEKAGLHANDEGYKMAVTDALSVAMKMLGVGADIYAGLWDGSKYKVVNPEPVQTATKPAPQRDPGVPTNPPATQEQLNKLDAFKKAGKNIKIKVDAYGWPITRLAELTYDQAEKLINDFSAEVKK